MRRALVAILGLAVARSAYRLLAGGALTLDVGVGRRVRALGPISWRIAAPREVVFEVIAAPYLGRTPRALEDKLQVWERGSDMVLAAHVTTARHGMTTTLETVRFEPPERIDFRLVRGSVPHVRESFVLADRDGETDFTWEGELGTDFWAIGAWWGDRVATVWESAVRASLASVIAESERRRPNRI